MYALTHSIIYLFHLFPCFFVVDPDGSAVTPTQTKVSRSDMISDLRVLLTCFSSSFCKERHDPSSLMKRFAK